MLRITIESFFVRGIPFSTRQDGTWNKKLRTRPFAFHKHHICHSNGVLVPRKEHHFQVRFLSDLVKQKSTYLPMFSPFLPISRPSILAFISPLRASARGMTKSPHSPSGHEIHDGCDAFQATRRRINETWPRTDHDDHPQCTKASGRLPSTSTNIYQIARFMRVNTSI